MKKRQPEFTGHNHEQIIHLLFWGYSFSRFRVVLEESAASLATQMPSFHELSQHRRRWLHFWEPLGPALQNGQGGVEPHNVNQLEWTHWMASPKTHGDIDIGVGWSTGSASKLSC